MSATLHRKWEFGIPIFLWKFFGNGNNNGVWLGNGTENVAGEYELTVVAKFPHFSAFQLYSTRSSTRLHGVPEN